MADIAGRYHLFPYSGEDLLFACLPLLPNVTHFNCELATALAWLLRTGLQEGVCDVASCNRRSSHNGMVWPTPQACGTL